MQYRILAKRHFDKTMYHPQRRFTFFGVGLGKWKDMTPQPWLLVESARHIMLINNVTLDKIRYEIE